jgi:hypothetical protein
MVSSQSSIYYYAVGVVLIILKNVVGVVDCSFTTKWMVTV